MMPAPTLAVPLPDEADLGSALAGFKEGLSLTQVPVLLTEPDLDLPGPRITFINSAMEHLCGWPKAELLGQTPRVFQG
ncbi:hypothetical protein ABTF63_19125, partial [Acinetobacter baumannii]